MNFIKFENSELSKDIILKPVLNFNFSTNILFRCTQKKYADDFLKGKLRFNQPKAWIKIEENGNKGQGDSLEGVCLATSKDDNSKFIENMKNNKAFESFTKNDMLYFRNKETKELFCFCLYGLNNNMFINREVDRFGEEHFIAKVKKEYFSAFAGNITEEEYFKMEEPNRQVILFIQNPHKFFEKIKMFFINLGVPKENIIISPVDYIDLRKKFINMVPKPYELLLKDSYFSNQSEIRIIINSTSQELVEYMKKNNNIIDIGSIEDIVTIYDNYFHDLLLEKRGNTLLFTLPFPVTEELSKSTLRELLAYYNQISNDRLPYETTFNERKEMLNGIEQIIKEKYDIYLYVDEEGKMNLSNVNTNIEELLDK